MKENQNAAELFLVCQSQWRVGFGGAYGLDYAVLDKVSVWLGFEMDRDLFLKIRLLERMCLQGMLKDKKHGE